MSYSYLFLIYSGIILCLSHAPHCSEYSLPLIIVDNQDQAIDQKKAFQELASALPQIAPLIRSASPDRIIVTAYLLLCHAHIKKTPVVLSAATTSYIFHQGKRLLATDHKRL